MDRAPGNPYDDDELEDMIEAWHMGDDPRPLHEYLGVSYETYEQWLNDPNVALEREY